MGMKPGETPKIMLTKKSVKYLKRFGSQQNFTLSLTQLANCVIEGWFERPLPTQEKKRVSNEHI